MPFVKGNPKPAGSGRRKGQVCRLAATVQAKLEELGCDPIEGMAVIALDPETPIEIRVKCFTELGRYLYPQKKAVEHTGVIGAVVTSDVSAIDILASRIAELSQRSGSASGNPVAN